jgi:hypothetical protein
MHKMIFAAALLFAATAVAPASPSAAIALLPRAVGDVVHVRVTRTDQELNAPRVAAEDLDIQLKPNNVLLLTRSIAGKPDLTVVRIGADGSLQIDPSEKAAGTNDADLTSILSALNLALATIHDAASAQAPWNATLAIPSLAKGPATNVVVPIAGAGNANAYEVQGSAQVAATPAAQPRGNGGDDGSGGGQRVRFGGGGMGGGFPGQRSRGNGSPAGGDQSRPMTLLVNVDGQVSAGRLRHLVISQTRVLTVDGAPFTNVTSWTVETLG